MIRTGRQYLDSIRDTREVYINGERVRDLTAHPMFKPLVDIRARIYDLQHEAAAVYRNFDWDGPLALVRESAGLSERVLGGQGDPHAHS